MLVLIPLLHFTYHRNKIGNDRSEREEKEEVLLILDCLKPKVTLDLIEPDLPAAMQLRHIRNSVKQNLVFFASNR